MYCETLWGDGHEKHATSHLSPCQGGDRALLPRTTVQSRDRERFHPSSLIFWVFTAAPMVSGSWLTTVSEVGWLRSFFWPGFSQVFADDPGTEPRARGAAHSTCQRSQPPVQAGGATAAVVHHSPAARCWLAPILMGIVVCPGQGCPGPGCQGGQRRQREIPKAVSLHIPVVLFQCLVCGWVSWWRGRVLEVGCYHQKRGIGIFRHNFPNPEQQTNLDTQPPTFKVAHGWCCNFSGCL